MKEAALSDGVVQGRRFMSSHLPGMPCMYSIRSLRNDGYEDTEVSDTVMTQRSQFPVAVLQRLIGVRRKLFVSRGISCVHHRVEAGTLPSETCGQRSSGGTPYFVVLPGSVLVWRSTLRSQRTPKEMKEVWS